MHEIAGSIRRKPFTSRSITRTVMVVALALAALTSLGAAPAGAPVWRVDGPGGGFFLSPVFAPSDPARIYVNGFPGILRSDDGGASYERLPSALNGAVLVSLTVDPADRDRLLAVVCDSSCERVARSLDGGLTWQTVLRDEAGGFPFTVRFGAGAAFVAAQQGMLRSDDGGATWSASGLEGLSVDGVWFDPRRPDVVLAVTVYPLTLWRSEDSGRSWVPVRTPSDWFAIYNLVFDPVRPGTLYAIANRHLVRSTDDGASWRTLAVSREFGSVGVLGDGTLFISPLGPRQDRSYGLLRSTDGGQTFAPARDPGNPQTARPDDVIGRVIPGPDPHQAFASGSLGLWSTVDSGRSWQPASRGLPMHFVQTLRASAGGEPRVYAVAYTAIFAREGVPGGWRKVHRGSRLDGAPISPREFYGFEVDPSNSLHLVAFYSSELLESRNGGRTWRSFPPAGIAPGRVDFATGLAVDWSTGAIYAAALESDARPGELPRPRLAVTRDDGATWERLRPFAGRRPVEHFLSLAVDPRDASVLWGKTSEAGLFRSGDGGHTWSRIGRGLPAVPESWREMRATFAFDPGDPQRMIAAIPGRGIWQSADDGRSFRRLGQGLETAVVATLANAADPATGRRFWLAGARSQGIFRLDGDRWTVVGTFAEPDQFTGAFTFDPVDPSVLYAGTFGSSVLRLDLR